MPQPLTTNDVLDTIWAHTIEIAATAVAGKGSARITAAMTTNNDGSIRPAYKVVTSAERARVKVTHFRQHELDQAVALYNSIVQGL